MRTSLRFAYRTRGAAVDGEVRRVLQLWTEPRLDFADQAAGPLHYGGFTIADGMFAPIVARILGYSVDEDAVARAYMEAVQATAGWGGWMAGARSEPWYASVDSAETIVEDLRCG